MYTFIINLPFVLFVYAVYVATVKKPMSFLYGIIIYDSILLKPSSKVN